MDFFMARSMSRLKLNGKRHIGIILFLLLAGCAHKPAAANSTNETSAANAPLPAKVSPEPSLEVGKSPLVCKSPRQWETQAFVHHDDWLGLSLDAAPIQKLQEQIEAVTHQALKSRGEAHITVLTPPEFASVKDKLSMDEIESVTNLMSIQKTRWSPLCVGRSLTKREPRLVTYYVVVESTGLSAIRGEIYRRYIERGGDPYAWTPNRYDPHITIGFSERDLFESDGIKKDRSQCVYDMISPEGQKLTNWK